MSIDYLKRCRHCDEIIAVAARRCPKCQSWQSRRGDVPNDPGWWWILLLLFPLLLFSGWLLSNIWNNLNRGGADFTSYRDQIELVETHMEFDDDHGRRKLSTVGMLKNHSPKKWRGIAIEVQYFDHDGHLVGARSQSLDMVLLPETEHAFELSGPAILPRTRYASQKVFIRDAREATRSP